MKTRKEVANNCPRHTGTFKSCNPNCVAPHTPTPWIAKPHKGDIKLMATIGGADGIQIAYTTPENAAFIVRACNSYEELLEALKEIQKLTSQRIQGIPLARMRHRVSDIANEAIARAEAV